MLMALDLAGLPGAHLKKNHPNEQALDEQDPHLQQEGKDGIVAPDVPLLEDQRQRMQQLAAEAQLSKHCSACGLLP